MQPELSPEQLAPELVSTGAQAIVDNAQRLGLIWTLKLATVVIPTEGAITATYDGDIVPIGMTNIMPFPVTVGQRVYAIYVPPSGNFIIGTPSSVTLAASLLEAIYPVGALYMSTASTDPATFLGGTWTALEDMFLVGAGSTFTAGATGGALTHDHTQADIGSSGTHTTTASAGLPSNTSLVAGGAATDTATAIHGHTITVSGTGAHTHVTPTTDASSFLPPWLAVHMWERTA
jgi:hypothetical protein